MDILSRLAKLLTYKARKKRKTAKTPFTTQVRRQDLGSVVTSLQHTINGGDAVVVGVDYNSTDEAIELHARESHNTLIAVCVQVGYIVTGINYGHC